jgi:hypothetical protein
MDWHFIVNSVTLEKKTEALKLKTLVGKRQSLPENASPIDSKPRDLNAVKKDEKSNQNKRLSSEKKEKNTSFWKFWK